MKRGRRKAFANSNLLLPESIAFGLSSICVITQEADRGAENRDRFIGS
jgi:hypothetical protein